jgi:hypothetical protein
MPAVKKTDCRSHKKRITQLFFTASAMSSTDSKRAVLVSLVISEIMFMLGMNSMFDLTD